MAVRSTSKWEVGKVTGEPDRPKLYNSNQKDLQATQKWEIMDVPVEDKSNRKSIAGKQLVENQGNEAKDSPGSHGSAKVQGEGRQRKKTAYQRAKDDFSAKKQKIAEEKIRRKHEAVAKQKKIQDDISKRKATFKIFSKKTKHGQPVMSGRMIQLLEKIQNST